MELFSAAILLLISPILGANSESKITGGNSASLPYQVSLQSSDRHGKWSHECSGAIYNGMWIITSAECAMRLGSGNRAVAGKTTLFDPDENDVQIRDIDRVHFYYEEEEEQATETRNNIALVRLRSGFALDGVDVDAIPLVPDDDQSNDLEDCKVGGWDNPDFTEEGDKELEVVDFPLIDDDDCKTYFDAYYTVIEAETDPSEFVLENIFDEDKELCAGILTGTDTDPAGFCSEDTGAPLVCTRSDDDRDVLFGIAAMNDFSKSNCRGQPINWPNSYEYTSVPGIFARMTKYNEWVRRTASHGQKLLVSNAVISLGCVLTAFFAKFAF